MEVEATIDPLPTRSRPKSLRFTRGPFGSRVTTLLVLTLPALWLAYLVFSYGVNTPWGDQWEANVAVFQARDAGTLNLGHFFAFHNEHRHFFPQLLCFALATVTHWNVRAELFVIYLLLCVCGFNIWRLALASGWRNSPAAHWLLLGANVLLFTPLQWENLLWGFQIGFLLPLATTTACLWLAVALRPPWNFVVTLVLCAFTTFCVASGFSAWLLTAPLLLMNGGSTIRARKWLWSIWCIAAVASIAIYFHGYERPPWHPSPLEAVRHPALAVQFILVYLGQPFSRGTILETDLVAAIIGAIFFGLIALSAGYVWRQRKDRMLLARSLPWFALAAIAFLNAVLTMIGRVGFGLRAAQQSRYVSFAVMLPIALIFLLPLVVQHAALRSAIWEKRGQTFKLGPTMLLTALFFLLLCGTVDSFRFWDAVQHNRLLGKSAILTSRLLDESESLRKYVHSSGPAIIPKMETLERDGYLNPARLQDADISSIAFESDGAAEGELTAVTRGAGGAMMAHGWGLLPQRGRTADSVLLTYEDAHGRPIIFARADVGEPIKELRSPYQYNRYNECGWSKAWNRKALPPGAGRIGAWVLDAEECRAYKIGEASFDQPAAAVR